MPALSIRVQSADAERAFKVIGAKAPVALARAINKSIGSARTLESREIARDMNLKVGVVRDQLRIHKAAPNRLQATLSAWANRIPLIDFKAKGPQPSRGRGRGVTAKLPGGAGRYPHAFIATMRSGHRGVFARQGKTRLGIYELFGPSIAHVFEKHGPAAAARAAEQLTKNVLSEINFVLMKGA